MNKAPVNILAHRPSCADSFIFMESLREKVCLLATLIDMSRIAFSKNVNSLRFLFAFCPIFITSIYPHTTYIQLYITGGSYYRLITLFVMLEKLINYSSFGPGSWIIDIFEIRKTGFRESFAGQSNRMIADSPESHSGKLYA